VSFDGDAARFLADIRARVLEAGGDLGDRTSDTEILIRIGRADEALARVEIFLGVNAAGKSLEQVTKPLTSVDQKAPAAAAPAAA